MTNRSLASLLAGALGALLVAAPSVAAQQPSGSAAAPAEPAAAATAMPARHGSPFLVKYGKWGLLAGAAGMDVLAAQTHSDANAIYADLRTRCTTDPARCALATDGRYADAESERLYRATLSKDRTARLWLVGGQVALLGSATMFIWELTRPKGPPDNVPFRPEVSATADGRTTLGLRVAF